MNCEEPEVKTDEPTSESEEITHECPIHPGAGEKVIMDDRPGRPETELDDVKRRIRDAVLSADQPPTID